MHKKVNRRSGRLHVLAVCVLLKIFGLGSLFAQSVNHIIYNATVYTLNPENQLAEAVAISGGQIVKVGKNEDVLALKSDETQLTDAGGRCLIPGIFDSHLHVIRGGRFYHAELRWDGVKSLKRALEMLREQAQRTPQGQWVRVVGGWNAYQFEEKRLPTLQEINEATGNVPTFILHLYGHAYLNKAGLELLHITSSTPNPPGGLIKKDEYGNPTGLLVAEPNAFLLYSTLAKLPELTDDEKRNSTLSFMRELNRLGITAVMDAGGGFQNYPEDYSISEALCEKDNLTVRLPYFLFAQKAGSEKSDFQRWIKSVDIGQGCTHEGARTKRYPGFKRLEYYVQGAGENLVMSAADFENFDQPRPELSPLMEAQLTEVLTELVTNRWPFRIHATYNESITRFLDVIEQVNEQVPFNGLIWFFDHAETVSEENLRRIKALGGGVAIQYRMAFQGESFIKRYGLEAAAEAPPIRKIIDMGIPVGMGSDGTRVSSFNPFVGLYWLTTGKTLGGIQHMHTENLLSRSEALRLYTQGSAQLVGLENDRGMIEEGFLADLVLLNANYFDVPDDEILALQSVLTILNGEVVYGSEEYSELDKKQEPIIPEWSPVKYFGGYQHSD